MKLVSGKNVVRTTTLAALLIGGGLLANAQQTNDQPVPADNTKVNQRDRSSDQPTADQQKMNPSDRDITQQIRKSIVADKSLSTYAHNVKVITQNGMVTLKGPVRTEEDKKAIEDKAAQVAGAEKVTSEIEVQPKH
jgi:osmotically-inducible protein OsmY